MNSHSCFHPVQNSTHMRISLGKPDHTCAMCNQNCSTGGSWPEWSFAGSIAVFHFAYYKDDSFFTVFLPINFQYPSTSKIFIALETCSFSPLQV